MEEPSSSNRKRPYDEGVELALPEGDLTADRLDEWLQLNDRQKICWALQTETRVRLDKVKHRDSFQVSTSLSEGNYLFQIYPEPVDSAATEEKSTKKPTQLDRDRLAYQRKSLPFLQTSRAPDGSWATLTPLTLRGYEQDNNALQHPSSSEDTSECSLSPVPPSFLFFRILLEGYMGYTWPAFHSADATLPRCAIMGGAVVAALTAFRDKRIVEMFRNAQLEMHFQAGDSTDYEAAYESLRLKVHSFFLYHRESSSFGDGDVDIFLQASPSTRSILLRLQEYGLDSSLLDKIESYTGGLGVVQDDLNRMVAKLQPLITVPDINDYQSGFVYALANNGLSFQFAAHEYDEHLFRETNNGRALWPRVSQLIMLKPQADLLGGLLDFDISTVSCAFDGNGVYVTPRASLSLATLTSVVTPFILNEKRNRGRIKKYWKRGFVPYMADPNCLHQQQCAIEDRLLVIEKGISPFVVRLPRPRDPETAYSRQPMKLSNQSEYRSSSRLSRQQRNDVYDFQEQHKDECTMCCGPAHGMGRAEYSMILMEYVEGDAARFFKEHNNWTADFEQHVNSIDPRGRLACSRCRYLYLVQDIVKKCDDAEVLGSKNDDFLDSEPACHGWKRIDDCIMFDFDFYCGATFDSRLAGRHETDRNMLLACVQAKENMEFARYIVKHGKRLGYQKRFVFGKEIDEVFDEASELNFAPPSRSPVGLNPERFLGKCQGCSEWLLDCEFSVKYCEACTNSKMPGR